MDTIVICSGGLDSVTLCHRMKYLNSLKSIISFDYSQRHKRELGFARKCAERLNVPFQLIDISSIGKALENSALTDNIDVPNGHYAEQSMKITEVPNRNAIFLTIAFGIAASTGADQVAIAVHGGDHFIYPDCRPDFLQAFLHMEDLSLEGRVKLSAPYVRKTKADIVKEGAEYGVPFQETWSCYKGDRLHCGRCGTCVERQEAFFNAGVKDPTQYEDPTYWQKAVHEYNLKCANKS